MESVHLPVWFPFQKISDMKIDEQEWKKLIIDRINILGINGDKEFQKDNYESQEEFRERGQIDIKGHFILKLGVYMDPRLSAWFMENEGDLFQFRFTKARWEAKKQILDYLFPDEDLEPTWFVIKNLEEKLKENIQQKFGLFEDIKTRKMGRTGRSYNQLIGGSMGKLIAIDFRQAAFIVKHRRALLYKGWVIGSIDRLMSTIKHKYQDLINKELIKLSERRQTEVSGPQKVLSDNINELLQKLIKPKKEFSMSGVVLKGDFDDHVSYYPPCIKDLMKQVEVKGYIAHWERFQLGLFLKHTGMDIETQLQYWYSKAVDNIGMSYTEFKKRAGYIIRHIYGLEGGKIDYAMPSCNTIQTKMYCYFRHKDSSIIAEELTELLKDRKGINPKFKHEITDLTNRGFTQQACAKYLMLLAGDTANEKIDKMYHPMIFLRVFAKSADIYKEIDEKLNQDNRKKDSPSNDVSKSKE